MESNPNELDRLGKSATAFNRSQTSKHVQDCVAAYEIESVFGEFNKCVSADKSSKSTCCLKILVSGIIATGLLEFLEDASSFLTYCLEVPDNSTLQELKSTGGWLLHPSLCKWLNLKTMSS